MKGYRIDLHDLPDNEKLLSRIDRFSDEIFLVANTPECYDVMWDLQESITSLFPELPASRVTELL